MFGWLFKRSAPEKRASGTGYTAQMMAAREGFISGRSGLAELSGTVQACVSLWEGGLPDHGGACSRAAQCPC